MPQFHPRRELARPELPLYLCQKFVRAVKIGKLDVPMVKGTMMIVPENPEISAFEISTEYYHLHHPHVGGYYVLYENNYESFAPADVFESGHTRAVQE